MHNNLIAATIGLAIGVISVTGIFIYHKIFVKQYSTTVSVQETANKKIDELQSELKALRLQLKQQKKKRKISRKFNSNDSIYTVTDNDIDVDGFSTETDIGDDEFYDCSDGESVASDNDLRISEELNQLDIIFKEIDEQVNDQFGVKTYHKLQTLIKSSQDNVEIVWRFARASSSYAELQTDKNVRRIIILEGIQQCERIIENRNPDLYKWYATLIGLYGDYLSKIDKINNGIVFKNYVIMALEMRPDDFELQYLLGRFKYEIANLSWIEKKLLFGRIPNATIEEALNCFKTAVKLGSKNLHNQLYISKCYIGLKNYSRAINFLKDILDNPIVTADDEKVHTEATKLFNEYSGYS
ncbi:PREDICTED: regulator of microtubule dynamics protein 2-like [Eufriesea mexicana]|uniref:regulator of microtubule dynamics protein 2-like n=1 Tax=Eufriesea mexicana TaxID=516756 RepID=UPI00083BE336|nr:PREDICTED: regulator of microtubule dynamics protein 2-like [Eufriesea mexicana]